MKRVFALALGLLSLLCAPVQSQTVGEAACPAQPVNGTPAAVISSMQKGFNLPGWTDRTRARRPDPALLATLAKLGFTHVRLPFEPQLVLTSFRDSFFKELDFALDQLIGLGFTVSLDNHPGERFTEGYEQKPDEGYARLLQAWTAIAEHVKARSRDTVFFELWNEPQIDAKLWRQHAARLIGDLRKMDPDRTIVFGDAPYQRYDVLLGEQPLPFPNVVYAVHYYDPMIFTHQGADWIQGSAVAVVRGLPFPAGMDDPRLKQIKATLDATGHSAAWIAVTNEYEVAWTVQRIEGELAKTGDWAKRHGVHIIINEFGVLHGAAPVESRIAWLKAVRQAAEKNCMGWTHWELLDGFGFVGADGRTIDTGIADALLTP